MARATPDQDVLIGRVVRLAALMNQINENALADEGLSRAEFEVLCALRRVDGGLRPSELTRETLSSGAATTKRLTKLERDGLITRATSTRDRREIHVRLADEGRALTDRLFPEQLRRERGVLAPLEPGEREQLGNLLAKVLLSLDGIAR